MGGKCHVTQFKISVASAFTCTVFCWSYHTRGQPIHNCSHSSNTIAITSSMPRASGKPTKLRHDPLHAQIEGDNELKQLGRVKAGKRRAVNDDEDEPVRSTRWR